ncbi:M20 family metallopeptidase [Rouxiella badensis]|uniref:M20 family metallopeptidase n=1 Tax=Rouxiella badensis TaxID=1646377 RepID=UPI0017878BDB|nr:M20 family metallopeptidase [Rouxiella badensis]QOI55322.1 amidohydrolase [Rouxiella badensis subsp. acadiensis]
MQPTPAPESQSATDSDLLQQVWSLIDEKKGIFWDLSDRIWETPEVNYTEFKSSQGHLDLLKKQGFRVAEGVADLPTAMMGEAGAGGPVIAILGEYDALPGLSQQADVAQPLALEDGANGHGCGHNMLGSAALLAATAVKDYLQANGLAGRVRYYGCPAEEGGSGKGFMVRAGLFDDVDVAICWHPGAFNCVTDANSLACNELNYHFSGRAAHAAATPHLGRSALDAVELMNVGINYLREHMPTSARIHYAITDSGGFSPNVVQAKATVRYLVRTRTLPELTELLKRVDKVAQGAALMTETTMKCNILSGDANLIGNRVLEELMQSHLEQLGGPGFDDADYAYAARFQETMSQEEIRSAYQRVGCAYTPGELLCDYVLPLDRPESSMIGSTDVGSVSWVVPTVQCRSATYTIGTPGHSWQLVAQGKSSLAHKGLTQAAKLMASTAVGLFTQPARIAEAKAEHARVLEGTPFVNPIPDDVQPPFPGSH